jgi:hypothetical protein
MAEKTNPTPPKADRPNPTDRIEKLFENIEEMGAKNRQAAHEAIDEYARLIKATVDYTVRLQDEWRRVALESSRRTADMMTAWV